MILLEARRSVFLPLVLSLPISGYCQNAAQEGGFPNNLAKEVVLDLARIIHRSGLSRSCEGFCEGIYG